MHLPYDNISAIAIKLTTNNRKMKIINWNVGRPSKNKGEKILEEINKRDADIIILTETNSSIKPKGKYNEVSTARLDKITDGVPYKEGEIRASIWTKYPVVVRYATYNDKTSVCADIKTESGILTVYATIIGIFGGNKPPFKEDLEGQLKDFDGLFSGKQVCIIGDYNISFTGRAYPSHLARQTLNEVFQKFKLINLTASKKDWVDHIAISSEYMVNKKVALEIWNEDKKLSDHIGVCATIIEYYNKEMTK